MRFEWDSDKAAKNVEAHEVRFEQATALFTSGVPVLEIYDIEHSEHEDRFKSIGPISGGVVLVVWTEREDDLVRIISAWWATKQEQEMYRNYLEQHDG